MAKAGKFDPRTGPPEGSRCPFCPSGGLMGWRSARIWRCRIGDAEWLAADHMAAIPMDKAVYVELPGQPGFWVPE